MLFDFKLDIFIIFLCKIYKDIHIINEKEVELVIDNGYNWQFSSKFVY